MSNPIRVQRRKTKGWRMLPNTAYVGRGSQWGNPFTWDTSGDEHPAVPYAAEIAPYLDAEFLAPLRGRNLARSCALGEQCHADVLPKLANP